MVAITDKFGRPSAEGDYAQATTVRIERSPGEPTLAAFDLSKFPKTAPVYFLTYKKTTDPEDPDKVIITNQTSWKALVNGDNNTLTNLTLAPGYTDFGQKQGDFIECIPTSYWGNDLVDGLGVSLNPDGSLKTSVLARVYPVGSIYINATNSANPATLLGFGTWVAFGAGRVPVGFDSGQSEFNAAQKTGGAKTHTLSVDQMPSHRHELQVTSSPANNTSPEGRRMAATTGASYRNTTDMNDRTYDWDGITLTGGGQAHNNLQPYITVYMWRRTA